MIFLRLLNPVKIGFYWSVSNIFLTPARFCKYRMDLIAVLAFVLCSLLPI